MPEPIVDAEMKSTAQHWIVNNIASPYGLAMVSYSLFMIACLIPPSFYTHYMNEPDLMFLDALTILFYTLCVVSFVSGVALTQWLFPPSPRGARQLLPWISPTALLMIPLTLAIAAAYVSIYLLLRQNPTIIVLLLSGQGGDLKAADTIQFEGTLTSAPLMLIAILWWAFWRHFDFHFRGWRKMLVQATLTLGVLTSILSSTMILSRSLLLLAICGLGVLYIARRTVDGRMSGRFVIFSGFAMFVGVSALFFAFGFLRGANNLDDQVHTLFGYSFASYNRLAALLHGTLKYPFGGRGIYLSTFVAYNHTLNLIVPIGKMMHHPDFSEVWWSEFGAVERAGLDGRLIWSGVFGYIFSDIGWLTLPFLFGYGLLYGVAWNLLKSKRIFGVIVYPCMGFCILFWLGSNFLLDSQPIFLAAGATMLAGLELLVTRRTNAGAST